MPSPAPRKGDKPTVAERIERARAAAAPKLEQAAAQASPKVEKAAQAAGSFLGLLRDRAKETAKQFSEGYDLNGDEARREAASGGAPAAEASTAETSETAKASDSAEPEARPRPRPRPGPRKD